MCSTAWSKIKSLLACCAGLLLAGESGAASWDLFHQEKEATYSNTVYIDRVSATPTNNGFKIWVKVERECASTKQEPQITGNYAIVGRYLCPKTELDKSRLSTYFIWFDCKKRNYAIASEIDYDLDGNIKRRSDYSDKELRFLPVAPDGVEEMISEKHCASMRSPPKPENKKSNLRKKNT